MLHEHPNISLIDHRLSSKEFLKGTVSKVDGTRDRLTKHARTFNEQLPGIGTINLLLNTRYARQSPGEALVNRFQGCFCPAIPYKPVREACKQEAFLRIAYGSSRRLGNR